VDGTVGGGHLKLGQQRQPVPVEGTAAAESKPSTVPAVAQQHLQFVAALAGQVGDVVGLVPQPVGVAGPPRRQHLVAHATPVQPGLVQAVRRGIEPCIDDPTGHVEDRAQYGRGRAEPAQLAGADEPRRPVIRGE
jgi:hypothetical protein